jgi:glycosyltransferase 2 family protein
MAIVLLTILWRIDLLLLLDTLARFDWAYGVAMMGVYLLVLLLFAWRWRLIAGRLGIQAGYRDYVGALWLSQAVGELGPSLIVGELARFHALRGRTDSGRLAASQLLDRCSGQVALVAMVAALLPAYGPLFGAGGASLSGIMAGGVLLFGAIGLTGALLQRVWPTLRSSTANWRGLLNPLAHPGHYGVSALLQALLTLNLALAAAGLGLGESLWAVALLGPLVLLGVGSLPGLVSDWGKREAAAVLLLAPAGLAPEQALAVSLIYGATHTLTALPGVLLLAKARRARAIRIESSL